MNGQYDCQNNDSSQCQFEALDASSPLINTITKTNDSTLTFFGDRLSFGNDIDCVMQGVVGIGANSGTQVSCVFPEGIPATEDPVTPELIFKRTLNGYDQENWANFNVDVTVVNEISKNI